MVFAAAGSPAQPKPSAETYAAEPFTLDAGRILLTLHFRAVDGRDRPALTWFNMGTPKAALSPVLRRDLGLGMGDALRFNFGTVPLELPPEAVAEALPEVGGEDALAHLFSPRPVEAILPARALLGHRVVLDYAARRMEVAPAGGLPPAGVATPLRLDPDTGLAALDVTIGGEARALVVDAGAAYSWIRGDVAASWAAAHPDWVRAEGAVGPSNMGLVDLAFEQHGTLLSLPDVEAGPLHLGHLGALGTAPLLCRLCDQMVGDLFWNGWAKSAPGPVVGWIGGDALGDFRLTVDYPARTAYWLRQRRAGPHVIDQVGITLVRRGPDYFVGGVVRKGGAATVEGATAGDRILAIDGRDPSGAASDDVRAALGGPPGTHHRLTLDRNGLTIEVDAPVTRF